MEEQLIGYLGASRRTGGPRSYYQEFLEGLERQGVPTSTVLARWVRDEGGSYADAAAQLVSDSRVKAIIAPNSEAEEAANKAAAASGKTVFGVSRSHSGFPRATPVMELLLLVEVLRQNHPPARWPPNITIIGSFDPRHQREELDAIERTAKALDIPDPQTIAVKNCDELVANLESPSDGRSAVMLLVDPLIGSCRHRFPAAAKASVAQGIPVLYGHPDFLRDGGGLVAFGRDARETYRNYARLAAQHLRGGSGAIDLDGPYLFIDPRGAPNGFDHLDGPFLGLTPRTLAP